MLNEMSVGGIRDRLLMLRSLSNLSGLDEDGYARLASHTIERVFQPGEVLLRENEPLRSGFLVVDGLVEVRRQGFVTARIDKGGVGFLSLLARDPRGVEAIAEKKSRTLEFPVEQLTEVYEENFSFLRNTLRLIATGILTKRDNLPRRADEGEDAPTGDWYDRPKTMVEKLIDATARPNIMTDMNLDAVIDWARVSKEIRVEAGHRFWSAGDPGSSTLMIDYGQIRCTAPDGRSTVVGHRYVLGSLDPLCGRARSYDAVAETKVIGLKMERDDWMSVIENHRRLGTNLARALATQLLHLQLEDAKRTQQTNVTAA